MRRERAASPELRHPDALPRELVLPVAAASLRSALELLRVAAPLVAEFSTDASSTAPGSTASSSTDPHSTAEIANALGSDSRIEADFREAPSGSHSH